MSREKLIAYLQEGNPAVSSTLAEQQADHIMDILGIKEVAPPSPPVEPPPTDDNNDDVEPE